MGKGYYISKTLGIAGIVIGAGAVATIIALSVVYSQEKAKNVESARPTDSVTTTTAKATVTTTTKPAVTTTTKPAVTTTATPTTTAQPQNPWNRYRLPDTLAPVHYDLTIWPRLKPDTNGMYIFTGSSSVIFKCLKATDLILIHSNKLNLTLSNGVHAKLEGNGGSNAPPLQHTWLEVKTQYLVVQLQNSLEAGKSYKLITDFQGELADDLAGFYRSVYTEEDGTQKVVATTQMQAADARKAFPCFDEPAMKATFNITVIHDRGTVALSNSLDYEVKDDVIDSVSVTVTKFKTTEKMSTYLLAFIVSDFGQINNTIQDVLVRIWARKKAIEDKQGDYALNVTGPILNFFETYYNVTYPLPKSDQIALPDFNAGAMENWGLITYRETALLYDDSFSSNGNKERVATVIAHELAHMWFGNLVTLKWWNDLWLNEGFASYVEYLGADFAEPDWNIKDLIVLNDVHRVFAVDALASSHPLSSTEDEIQTPAQISELFDSISYSKGASVLRMLSDFLTEGVFVKGINAYLTHFSFNNTVYTDLWDHLETAVDNKSSLPATVEQIMNRWVLQMGFPVVTIDTTSGQISQKHFLLDPDSVVNRTSIYNYVWYIPMSWMKSGEIQTRYWLLNSSNTNQNMIMSNTDWLLANINVTGYFRVNYDENNWNKLLRQLEVNHENIPVINRAQLVDDAFNLARAKIRSTVSALSTTKYLSNETEYMPWQSAIDNLGYFFLMFDRTEVNGPMQAYLKKQVSPLFKYFENITFNWTVIPEGHTEQYNQVNAIKVACSNGHKECQELATKLYGEWMANPQVNPIHPNLRTSVYCSAIATGGTEEWNFGWRMFTSSTIATETDKLRAALACSKQPWLLNRYLEYTLDSQKIRKQDATSTIVYVANNVVGQSLAWDFIRAHWSFIFTQYGGGSFSFSNLISGVTKRFSTEFELRQLEQFQKDNADVGFGSGTRALEQAKERTRANIKWVKENKDAVLKWFTEASA
uniref:Aminopeptidase n=1 Tax=Lepisosteus oculatus TaxID=7918 RepID=W5NB25_LEPOC|nr:PREDICTED: aminopeptidase N [Lepisosteus oculatus]